MKEIVVKLDPGLNLQHHNSFLSHFNCYHCADNFSDLVPLCFNLMLLDSPNLYVPPVVIPTSTLGVSPCVYWGKILPTDIVYYCDVVRNSSAIPTHLCSYSTLNFKSHLDDIHSEKILSSLSCCAV